jgi:NADP-dependent 3-hydroxy acid dehydrogenase YdfG
MTRVPHLDMLAVVLLAALIGECAVDIGQSRKLAAQQAAMTVLAKAEAHLQAADAELKASDDAVIAASTDLRQRFAMVAAAFEDTATELDNCRAGKKESL